MPALQAVASGAEDGSEILPQWVEPDVLDGDVIVIGSGSGRGRGGATCGYAMARAGLQELFCEHGART